MTDPGHAEYFAAQGVDERRQSLLGLHVLQQRQVRGERGLRPARVHEGVQRSGGTVGRD